MFLIFCLFQCSILSAFCCEWILFCKWFYVMSFVIRTFMMDYCDWIYAIGLLSLIVMMDCCDGVYTEDIMYGLCAQSFCTVFVMGFIQRALVMGLCVQFL